MIAFLGKDWKQYYPATLTKEEKAKLRNQIGLAFVQNLQSARNPMEELKHHLQMMKLIDDYPTKIEYQTVAVLLKDV